MNPLSSPRIRRPWFVTSAAVVAIIVVGLVIFFTESGGNRQTSSPKAVTNAWLRASRDNDVPRLKAYSCTSLAARIARDPRNYQNLIEPQLTGWTILKTTQHGEQADVDLALHFTVGSGSSGTFGVVHTHGQWRVCDVSGFGS